MGGTSVYKLVRQLLEEREHRYKNGIYYYTQVELAYNSNRIEGSRLKREHTEGLFSTQTILAEKDDVIRSDDVIETMNHFRAFDYLLDHLDESLSEVMIKELHGIIKAGTADSQLSWFRIGEYKTLENLVGLQETTKPEDVSGEMGRLLDDYHKDSLKTFDEIVRFHVRFERIHPFSDGNGRAGRLIMFRECLKNEVVPFIIDAGHKEFYYRGLREYFREPGYLIDTCLSAQDKYRAYCKRLVHGLLNEEEDTA